MNALIVLSSLGIQEMMEIKTDDAVAQLKACANEESLVRLYGALLFAHAAIAAELMKDHLDKQLKLSKKFKKAYEKATKQEKAELLEHKDKDWRWEQFEKFLKLIWWLVPEPPKLVGLVEEAELRFE